MSVILAAGGIVSAITTKGIALCIYYDRNTFNWNSLRFIITHETNTYFIQIENKAQKKLLERFSRYRL